jgi:Rod binding domain-containing protein
MIEGASGMPSAGGLPVVDQALEPEWVRDGSPATQKAYAIAESFEAMLVQQLSKSMASTSGLEGEEGSGAGEGDAPGTTPQASQLSTLLPQALSDGVMRAGGLGMASQLTRELMPASASASSGATVVGASDEANTHSNIGVSGGTGAGDIDANGGVAT